MWLHELNERTVFSTPTWVVSVSSWSGFSAGSDTWSNSWSVFGRSPEGADGHGDVKKGPNDDLWWGWYRDRTVLDGMSTRKCKLSVHVFRVWWIEFPSWCWFKKWGFLCLSVCKSVRQCNSGYTDVVYEHRYRCPSVFGGTHQIHSPVPGFSKWVFREFPLESAIPPKLMWTEDFFARRNWIMKSMTDSWYGGKDWSHSSLYPELISIWKDLWLIITRCCLREWSHKTASQLVHL